MQNISIKEAQQLLDKYLKNNNLKKHCLAVAEIMFELAKLLNESVEEWYITGILHDLDFEKTKNDSLQHGLITARILEGKVNDTIISAIKKHNFERLNLYPEKNIDYALICADAISGLIISCILVMPNKKIEEVSIKTVLKKFKEKDFAKNVSREKILYCEKLGLSLEKFIEISLNALKKIVKNE